MIYFQKNSSTFDLSSELLNSTNSLAIRHFFLLHRYGCDEVKKKNGEFIFSLTSTW